VRAFIGIEDRGDDPNNGSTHACHGQISYG